MIIASLSKTNAELRAVTNNLSPSILFIVRSGLNTLNALKPLTFIPLLPELFYENKDT
jgi:hypothetical protein